jgi:hypothetical protein
LLKGNRECVLWVSENESTAASCPSLREWQRALTLIQTAHQRPVSLVCLREQPVGHHPVTALESGENNTMWCATEGDMMISEWTLQATLYSSHGVHDSYCLVPLRRIKLQIDTLSSRSITLLRVFSHQMVLSLAGRYFWINTAPTQKTYFTLNLASFSPSSLQDFDQKEVHDQKENEQKLHQEEGKDIHEGRDHENDIHEGKEDHREKDLHKERDHEEKDHEENNIHEENDIHGEKDFRDLDNEQKNVDDDDHSDQGNKVTTLTLVNQGSTWEVWSADSRGRVWVISLADSIASDGDTNQIPSDASTDATSERQQP